MKVVLEIDYYAEGYGSLYTNCFDNAFAAASGYFLYENYYYYNLYFVFLSNWVGRGIINSPILKSGLKEDRRKANYNSEMFYLQKLILNKLGIELVEHKIENAEQFTNTIENCINSKQPVIMIPVNRTLYYYDQYLTKNEGSHSIIISGYDQERNIYLIQEALFDTVLSKEKFKGEPFYKLFLKKEDLIEIWENSKMINKERNNFLYGNEIISLKHTNVSKLSNYGDLLCDLIENTDINDAELTRVVNEFNENMEKFENQDYVANLRRKFHYGLYVLFDILQKIIETSGEKDIELLRLNNFKSKYISQRVLLINKIHYNSLKKRGLTQKNIDEITVEISEMDFQLFSYIQEILVHNGM